MSFTEPDPEADDELFTFTPEDQLDLLRSNNLAMALATVAFLEKRGISATDWAHDLGHVFARGWDTEDTWTAEDFLDATIVNLTVLGGEATQAEFADDVSTAVITYLPDLERVEGMGLESANGDLLYDMITPIARACGLEWNWSRDGETVQVRVSTPSEH